MKKQRQSGLDFEIDELTNSIENVVTGDSFPTDVSFISKTQLFQHYIDTLGAMHFGGRVMIIDTNAALKLLNKYFPK